MFWQIVCFILLLLLLLVLIFFLYYRDRHRSRPPQSLNPPRFDRPVVAPPPLAQLGPDTVEDFLRWVAAVPVSEAQLIRDKIAAVAGDDAVLDAMVAGLFQLPVQDFGRHLMILSVLGEMRHPRSVEPLKRFVNLPGDAVIPRPPTEQGAGLRTSHLDYSAALQARAVEMLAYVRTPDALEAALQAGSGHASRAVRVAALDAFIFNHEDNPEAIERACRAARPEEAKLVGLPRRERNMDLGEFDARTRAFYERYPEENPPIPQHTAEVTPGHTPVESPRERRQPATPS